MQGLQIFDPSGNILLDVSDNLTRVLGVTQTGFTNGSLTDPNLLTGRPWFTMLVNSWYDTASFTQSASTVPGTKITIDGSVISWIVGYDLQLFRLYIPNITIIYGVY